MGRWYRWLLLSIYPLTLWRAWRPLGWPLLVIDGIRRYQASGKGLKGKGHILDHNIDIESNEKEYQMCRNAEQPKDGSILHNDF